MDKEKEYKKEVKPFEPILEGKDSDQVSTLLSSRRTGLSFQRTRLGADRTLMAVIRTALSLISFGFTIFQFFYHFKKSFDEKTLREPRIFGFTLVSLGILMLVIGISYHAKLMYQIRKERTELTEIGLITRQDTFPISMTLIIAILLLLVGIVSFTTMYFQYR